MGRLMFVLQLAGSMLAIPVGLASAYSIYRANFAPETTCQNLRASIVAMIDKQIDASTRRMLVRHDVETFEKTCGAFDPDAEAAFKTLLAADAVKATPTPAKTVEPPVKETRAVEPRVVAAPAEKPVREASREHAKEPIKPAAERDASSDARWLDAVRSALVTHEKDGAAADALATSVKPLGGLVIPAHAARTPVSHAIVPQSAEAAPPVAPALPPPSDVKTTAPMAVAARPVDPDHPVPPASIPTTDAPSGEPVVTGATPAPTSWYSHLPFIGR